MKAARIYIVRTVPTPGNSAGAKIKRKKSVKLLF